MNNYDIVNHYRETVADARLIQKQIDRLRDYGLPVLEYMAEEKAEAIKELSEISKQAARFPADFKAVITFYGLALDMKNDDITSILNAEYNRDTGETINDAIKAVIASLKDSTGAEGMIPDTREPEPVNL